MTKRKTSSEKQRTVTVRIAVAVDPSGRWNASGWSNATTGQPEEGAAMDLAIEGVDEGEARYWVEATLPLPSSQVVRGTVVETEDAER